jgi:hypothetical protein
LHGSWDETEQQEEKQIFRSLWNEYGNQKGRLA